MQKPLLVYLSPEDIQKCSEFDVEAQIECIQALYKLKDALFKQLCVAEEILPSFDSEEFLKILATQMPHYREHSKNGTLAVFG